MLYALALILIIAWLLGLVAEYTFGGFIHLLLAGALILIFIQLLSRKKV